MRQLLKLKGIGDDSARLFVMEFFSWRDFHNRRQVGSLLSRVAARRTSKVSAIRQCSLYQASIAGEEVYKQ